MPSMFGKVGSKIGDFIHGNYLNGHAARPVTQPYVATAKRSATSDPNSSNPPKRRRTDEDVHETHPTGSSPELREPRRPASSPVNRKYSRDSTSIRSISPLTRKGARDSQSLISSGDRQSRGAEVSEFRAAARHADAKGRGRRSRHVKRGQQLSDGHIQPAQETPHGQKTTQGPPIRHNRRLVQNREVPGDQIEDDDLEILDDPLAPKQKRLNGSRVPAPRYQLLRNSSSSEDEKYRNAEQDEIAKLPTPEPRKPAAQRPEEYPLLVRTKRPAASPDELELPHTSKRRVDRADSVRADSVSKRISDSRSSTPACRVLKVDSAVCEPRFVYPAGDDTYENDRGANNRGCALSKTGVENRMFRTVDNYLIDLPELAWMTPDLSKVTEIKFNEESPVVLLRTMRDSKSELSCGSLLLIKFKNKEDANLYSWLCGDKNRGVRLHDSIKAEKLERIFSQTLSVVMERNRKKPAAGSPDMEVRSRVEVTDESSGKPMQSKSRPVVQTEKLSARTQKKAMRAQMVDEAESRLDDPTSKHESKQRKSMTPGEEQNLRSLFPEDDIKDGKDEDKLSLGRKQDRTPLQSIRTATSRPQRSLRSSQAAARSSPLSPERPPPERWTYKNPEWIRDHNWNIPLIYERTTVNCGDIACLDEGQFLNDAIISFYANYLHKELEKKDENLANKVYIFNSFFWETFRAKGYDGVKNWTAKVDLLSYDYIVVPINQHAHWYLAIICNPGALISKDEPDDDVVRETVDDHNEEGGALSENTTEAKMANVTSDLSQVSIEDHLDEPTAIDVEGLNGTPSAKKSKTSKRRVAPRKYDPKAPRVITLDSLDGTHSAVAGHLKAYLIREIKERKRLDVAAPSPFGTTAKDIPMQLNFTDCGVYLLGYIEEFMKDPHRFTRRILQQEKRDWDVDAPALRDKIRGLIFELQTAHQKAEMRRKREKAMLSSQKQTKAQTSTTVIQPPANSATDSEQHTRKASRSPAVDRQNTPRSTGSPAHYVNGNGNSRPTEVKTGNSKSPTPRTQPPSPIRSPPIIENEAHNVNASMIVHPNESIELDSERNSVETDATPNIGASVQIKSNQVRETSRPNMSSESRQVSESHQISRDRSTKGDYDQRRFLGPLSSSPSASPAPTLTGSVERNGTSPATMSGKHTTPKQDDTRSRYFSSSKTKPPNLKAPSSISRSGAARHIYSAIDSSPDGEARRHQRKPKAEKSEPRQTIDLTDD